MLTGRDYDTEEPVPGKKCAERADMYRTALPAGSEPDGMLALKPRDFV